MGFLNTISYLIMKKDFNIKSIDKADAKNILSKYHYLGSKFRTNGYNYGLFFENNLVGVIIFSNLPVPELAVGLFGFERNNQCGLFELSRLCLVPHIQYIEHNIASWFISKAIKKFKKDTIVKAILSYADNRYHKGIVYRASNFKYYGLTKKKKDFYFLLPDGTYKKHTRGSIKGLPGEWRERNRKHRYLKIFDKSLIPRWEEISWNNKQNNF